MKWVLRIIQSLLAIAFFLAGIMKLIGHEKQVQTITEVFEYSLGFMYLIGVCEILVAIGILIGFWKSRLTFLASVSSVLIMAGAVLSHFNAGEGIDEAMPSIILLILGIVAFIGSRAKTTKKKQSYSA